MRVSGDKVLVETFCNLRNSTGVHNLVVGVSLGVVSGSWWKPSDNPVGDGVRRRMGGLLSDTEITCIPMAPLLETRPS